MDEELEKDDLFAELDEKEREDLTPSPSNTSEDEGQEPTDQDQEEDLHEAEEDLMYQDDLEDSQEEEQELPERAKILDYLQSSGFVSLPEGFDYGQYSDDDLEVIISNSIESSVEDRIRASFDQLPPFVRELVSYSFDGGNVEEFLDQIANSRRMPGNIDINDPSHQEYIVRNALASQGYDNNYIESQVRFLTENNYLATHAHSYYQQSREAEAARMQQMAEQQMENERLAREEAYRRKVALQEHVNKTQSVGAMSLSLRDRNEVVGYMSEPAYQLEDGSTLTAMQKDLLYDVQQNPNLALQIALLLKNRGTDGLIDFSFIERSATTKATRKVKEGLTRTDRTTPSTSSNKYPNYKSKALTDYFD